MESSTHLGDARPARRRRAGSVVLAALSLLLIPALVYASHQFNDVATGASYHDEVESLVGAGITAGCGGSNYCPGQAVTRGQMAQFMVRGAGIGAAGYGELFASETEEFYVATVALRTGGLSGGTGYVTVDADLSVLDFPVSMCPCGVIFSIEETTTFDFGPLMSFGTSPVVADGSAGAGSVSWVFEVPTGTDVEFGLWASIFADGPMTTGISEPVLTGSITAEYSPFGTAGELPVKPISVDVDGWSGPSPDGPSGRRVQGR
jgi:hypothetical protein